MNERIKQLAEQAGADTGQIIANVICGDDEFAAIGDGFNKLSKETRDLICEAIEQNQENFAESIVRECIQVLKDTGYPNIHGNYVGVEELKQHFEIK